MELRSLSHFHFVRCIKGGSVEKCMNVDTRGRPALKFKEVKKVYNLGDAELYHDQVPRILLRDDLESTPTKCYAVKVESPNSSVERGIQVKSEPEDSDSECNTSGGEGNDDLNDLSFGNMTLKQIQKRCSRSGGQGNGDLHDLSFSNMTLKQIQNRSKAKKRKRLNTVGLNKETVETCSSVKHEFPEFQLDDKYDLDEPLVTWKSKLSKNMKSKRKSLRKNVSGSSPNVLSIIKSELDNRKEDLLQPNGEWPAPIDIKVEVPEPGYSECQTIFSVTNVSDFSCCQQADSFISLSDKVLDTTDARMLETELPHPTEETQYCSLNEVSYEYMEVPEPKFDVGVSGWEIVKVDSPEILSYEYSDPSEFEKEDYVINPLQYDVPSEPMSPARECSCQSDSFNHEMPQQADRYSSIQLPEQGVSFYPIEEPLCIVSNGVSYYEYVEDVHSQFGAKFCGWEIVKVDSPEIIGPQCSDIQEFEEGSSLYPVIDDISLEPMSPSKDHSPDLSDSFKGNSSEHKMAWQTTNYCQIEVPEMDGNDRTQCLESMDEGISCSFESRTVDDLPSNGRNIATGPYVDNSSYWSSPCLNPETHSVTVSGDSQSAEKQSSSPASRATNSFGDFDQPKISTEPQDYLQMKQHHLPERLLSNRKTISPTSQERLCWAMESTVLDDNDRRQQCRGKLYFGKQTNHRILRAQGLDQLRREGASINPKSIMRKIKQDKKGSPPKGILKVTHPSRTAAHVSTAPSTLQRCSQSAITFSQRQMRDIESLANKLTRELKSMKDIVKEKLHCEASAAIPTKENADEVRIAIEHATKVEETAKRWLSIMARDCNRFCKIMRLTEDNAASERTIHKERKITFADEAGGKLCHVKVFKNDIGTASSPKCGGEKQRLLVE